MNGSPEPVRPASHFDFGRNWAEYAEMIDEAAVECAKAGLDRLGLSDLHGKTFLDIGCGSGIHALAAARQGAIVTALDIDRDSVDTTNRLFAAHGRTAVAIQRSIFDACPADPGTFDIVYSWGVLHHTGDVWHALQQAMQLVSPGGILAIALYERTSLCWAWKLEKRLYSNLPALLRTPIKYGFGSLVLAVQALRHRIAPTRFIGRYRSDRGMAFWHDIDDWLGGYPYQSTRAEDVVSSVEAHGFQVAALQVRPRSWGLMGAGCSEYTFAETGIRLRAQ